MFSTNVKRKKWKTCTQKRHLLLYFPTTNKFRIDNQSRTKFLWRINTSSQSRVNHTYSQNKPRLMYNFFYQNIQCFIVKGVSLPIFPRIYEIWCCILKRKECASIMGWWHEFRKRIKITMLTLIQQWRIAEIDYFLSRYEERNLLSQKFLTFVSICAKEVSTKYDSWLLVM